MNTNVFIKSFKYTKKLIASTLLYMMSFNVFANVVLDPSKNQNTSLDRSNNGIPIVNISTPNNHGVSINNFLEYNVGTEGQILNNADNLGRSHLAGIINANPNLGPNQAANLVILQVNGSNRSQIEGYIEALSREKINVILSNENGIYLDGAGTINIRNFTPTTGKVNLFDGQYVGIDVEKGQVVIGQKGFDATNTDYVNVIAKALELQGSLVGNKVDVTVGENKVDSSGNVTSKNGVNSVAIDASLLGSMYAGQVKIISTDRGAGVNSSSLIYSRDKKLEITADGKVNVATIKGQGIDIKASEYNQTQLASSDKDINIVADKISLQGQTQATDNINLVGDVNNKSDIYTNKNLDAKNLVNSGNINVAGNVSVKDLVNSNVINVGQNLNTKNVDNIGAINVSELTDIDGRLDNKGSLVSIGNISVKGNISNTDEIYTKGSLTGDDLFNAGEITVLKNISSKSIDNTKEIISGKGITTGNTKNSGILLTADKLNVSGNIDNSGILEAQDIKVKGDTFSNKGNISSDNISAEIKDTKNEGRILSSNDVDLKTKTLTNTKEILAVNDIKIDNADITNTGEIASNKTISLNNTDTKNSGKIVSNREVLLNNSNISNSGEILSDNVEMKDNNQFVNTGEIKGNKTTLTTTKDIDLVGTLHGENRLVVSGNNIVNNGATTGKGLIAVTSNGFINNKELSADNLIINATGNILNNNILGGENATLKGANFENRDLVAVNKDLNIETTGNIVNRKGNVIYSGNKGTLTGNEILNLEGEILSKNLELNGRTLVLNEVGLIQTEEDLKIKAPVFQNIGRVSNLDKYERYYETWDGKVLSEQDVNTKWLIHYEPRSWKGSSAIRYQEQWFDELAMYSEQQTGYNSYIFSKSIDSVKRFLGLEGDYFVYTSTAEVPVKALEGKIRSNATTEYGRVIAGRNITIDTTNTVNKDSIISAGNIVEIKADTIDHNSTLGNPVQLKDGREKVYIHYKNSREDSTNAYLRREMIAGGTGYITGSPSVIEGRVVLVDSTKILPQSIPESKGVLRNTLSGGQGILKNINIGNGISSKNTGIQIVGNTQNISNVINTGIVSVTPVLNNSMFKTNVEPGSKYLLETRSEYVNLSNYVGSDYFLTRVSYTEDWTRAKRLGDAYYENQLITRALNEKLGTAFLNNMSGTELVQSMIDNAVSEQSRLSLEVGKELTAEQISNLNEDIIWYIETEVNGQKVLTPQVYLSSKSRNNLEKDDRDRIGGTEYTEIKTKELDNKGLKLGNTGVTVVNAERVRNETVSNRISEITGNMVFVETKGNIENIGGKITGRDLVLLKSEEGNILNNGQKTVTDINNGTYDRTRYEEVGSVGLIQGNKVILDAGEYTTEGGVLLSEELKLDLDKMNILSQELSGSDKTGTGGKNYRTFDSKENVGSAVISGNATGRVGEVNIRGSVFDVEDGAGLNIGRVRVESSVNEYDEFSLNENRNSTSKSSRKTESHTEENVSGTFRIGANANIQGTVDSIGSNVYIGDNSYVGGKVTTDSRELNNSYYEENKKSGFSGGISGGSVSILMMRKVF